MSIRKYFQMRFLQFFICLHDYWLIRWPLASLGLFGRVVFFAFCFPKLDFSLKPLFLSEIKLTQRTIWTQWLLSCSSRTFQPVCAFPNKFQKIYEYLSISELKSWLLDFFRVLLTVWGHTYSSRAGAASFWGLIETLPAISLRFFDWFLVIWQ